MVEVRPAKSLHYCTAKWAKTECKVPQFEKKTSKNIKNIKNHPQTDNLPKEYGTVYNTSGMWCVQDMPSHKALDLAESLSWHRAFPSLRRCHGISIDHCIFEIPQVWQKILKLTGSQVSRFFIPRLLAVGRTWMVEPYSERHSFESKVAFKTTCDMLLQEFWFQQQVTTFATLEMVDEMVWNVLRSQWS